MAIKKITLPNSTTQDVQDARLPDVTSSDDGKVLGVSSGLWSAISKPSYTLDEVSDGSNRKLANYLPLAGGTMTGLPILKFSNARVAFQNANGTSMGAIGVRSAGVLEFYDTSLWNTVYHSGNFLAGTNYQKPITISSSEPTSSQGSDGDIWIVV